MMDEQTDLALRGKSDEELVALAAAIGAEQARRQSIAVLPERIDRMVDQYQEAMGRETGGEWTQPLGAHDAYREGAVVTLDGQRWRSLIPSNVWQPGADDRFWVVGEDAEAEPPPAAAAWEPGIAYAADELVAYEGVTYRVLQAHTSTGHWLPPEVPSLYVTA